MKLSPISNNSYDKKSRTNKQNSFGKKNCTPPNNVSFGSLGGAISDKAAGFFKFIEKYGFFVEFLIIDTCSLVIPRILIGLNRDKDKTGKINYKAGAEEAGREMSSGPSMNLIPMALLALVSKLKPASHMERETLTSLTNNMKEVVEGSVDLKNKAKLNKKLAEKIFDNAFTPDKFNTEEAQEVKALKGKFVELLTGSTKVEKKLFKKEAFNNSAKEFNKLVGHINNLGKEAPENKSVISLIDGGSVGAKDLFEDFHNYSKDVIEKLTKTDFAENIAKKSQDFLDKLKTNRLKTKTMSAITAFFAVGSFLLYLPKLYQRGKVSPAEESAKRAREEVLGGANENK